MTSAPRQSAFGFRLIGASKLATALALGAAGFGIFRLLNKDLGEVIERFVLRLHLDPENRIIQETVAKIGGIDRSHLKAIGVGTFFYSALELVEGVGLIFLRPWAEYLTIVATALLLPPEIYEIAHKVSAIRVAVLVVNLAILVYLIVKIRQKRRSEAAAG
jgi:uncharacterized membrane protein (DUF2068 family)